MKTKYVRHFECGGRAQGRAPSGDRRWGWVPDGWAELEPGEVVTVDLLAPYEHPGCPPKRRPAVLLDRGGASWSVAGLTHLETFASGTPRIALPDCRDMGLLRQSYLWGARPALVDVLLVRDHLGYITPAVASLLIAELSCSPEIAARLMATAHDHHRDSVSAVES